MTYLKTLAYQSLCSTALTALLWAPAGAADFAQITVEATVISVSGTTASTPDHLSFDATPEALSQGGVTTSAPTAMATGSEGLILSDCSPSTLSTSEGTTIPYTLEYKTANGSAPLDATHCTQGTYVSPNHATGSIHLVTAPTATLLQPNQSASGTTIVDISAP